MADTLTNGKASGESSGRSPAHGFLLLEAAASLPETTVRDDQQEFAWLLDAARVARRGGRRFRLVDSGRLDAFSLEWLAGAGADLYTADDVRPDVAALTRVRRAGRSHGAIVAFFHYGPLDAENAAAPGLGREALAELLGSGVDVHLSNRKSARPVEFLLGLALSARTASAELVYYHHGPLMPGLEDLAESGAWVHVGDEGVDIEAEAGRMRDIARAGRRSRGGLVLHMEKHAPSAVLVELRREGAFLLSAQPSSEPLTYKPLLQRAYYLDTTFMP